MKKKIELKKLKLNKEKIAQLSTGQMSYLVGGNSVIKEQQTKNSCANCNSGFDACTGGGE